jgi:energy-coupling factor transporter ATP-binding protein EcfA2
MSVTIQEITLAGFGVVDGDDPLVSRINLEGTKGEMILLTCATGDLTAIAGEYSKATLANLVQRNRTAKSTGGLLDRRTATTEEHVAAHIGVVKDGAALALILNTIEDKQLRILLMPAQRDALLQLLGEQDD